MSSDKHVICIGAFDGVHRGHQLLISRGREFADTFQVPLIAVTFDPHPRTILRPEGAPPALCTLDRRIQYLLEAGVDEVDVIEFDADFASLSAEEFIDDVIVDGLHASVVVVGEDFRFGVKGSGSVATLANAGETRGFAAEAVSLFLEDDEKVSSSRIREEVLAGDVLDAARLLGRPYSMEGTVVHGDHRGRELGYPTANLAWVGNPAVPADGVYASFLVIDGEYLPDASAAWRPTCWTASTSTSTGSTLRWSSSNFCDRSRSSISWKISWRRWARTWPEPEPSRPVWASLLVVGPLL